MRIRIVSSGREFDCGPGESLLDAALAAGHNLPHSCRGGNCGACRALKVDGDVHYPNGPPLGLSLTEVQDGYVLLCQARPLGNLRLDLPTVQRADEVEVRRVPCRILRRELLAHDVMMVTLQLPAAEPMPFRPGQYVDVLLPQGRRRSFSIAPPSLGNSHTVDLLVRRVPGGLFSDLLFERLLPGSLLEIEGPFGQFYVREDAPPRPLLLVAGGTGIAPVMHIAKWQMQQGYGPRIHLYWGVRSQRDLFSEWLLGHAAEMTRGNFSYELVLSEPDATWQGRTGWVHEAALSDLGGELVQRAFEVYAAGPPAMINALRAGLQDRGMPPERLHVDVFDYAIDGPRDSRIAPSNP